MSGHHFHDLHPRIRNEHIDQESPFIQNPKSQPDNSKMFLQMLYSTNTKESPIINDTNYKISTCVAKNSNSMILHHQRIPRRPDQPEYPSLKSSLSCSFSEEFHEEVLLEGDYPTCYSNQTQNSQYQTNQLNSTNINMTADTLYTDSFDNKRSSSKTTDQSKLVNSNNKYPSCNYNDNYIMKKQYSSEIIRHGLKRCQDTPHRSLNGICKKNNIKNTTEKKSKLNSVFTNEGRYLRVCSLIHENYSLSEMRMKNIKDSSCIQQLNKKSYEPLSLSSASLHHAKNQAPSVRTSSTNRSVGSYQERFPIQKHRDPNNNIKNETRFQDIIRLHTLPEEINSFQSFNTERSRDFSSKFSKQSLIENEPVSKYEESIKKLLCLLERPPIKNSKALQEKALSHSDQQRKVCNGKPSNIDNFHYSSNLNQNLPNINSKSNTILDINRFVKDKFEKEIFKYHEEPGINNSYDKINQNDIKTTIMPLIEDFTRHYSDYEDTVNDFHDGYQPASAEEIVDVLDTMPYSLCKLFYEFYQEAKQS